MLEAPATPDLQRGPGARRRGARVQHLPRRGASSPMRSRISSRGARRGSCAVTWPRTRSTTGSSPVTATSPAATCRCRTTTSPRARSSGSRTRCWWRARWCCTSRTFPSSGSRSSSRTCGPGRHSGLLIPAVRLLRHHPPVAQLLPADHEHGVLLGDQRLHGPHRAHQLVLGALRGARLPDRLPLAQPVPERHVRDQQAVGVRAGARASSCAGTTPSSSA